MSSDNSDDPKIKEVVRQMMAEHEAIMNSIGLVTRAWATLESALCESFQILGGFGEAQYEAAGVIFYTPSNMETRVSLVDRLVTFRCEFAWLWRDATIQHDPLGDAINTKALVDEPLLAQWKNIKGKIDALKSTRNAIVHGLISSSSRGPHNQTSRLTPALGDLMRYLPPIIRGQHPGFGSNELKNHEQAVWRVNDRVRKLNEAFRLRMQVQLGQNPQDAIQKLLGLLPQIEKKTS